MKATTLTTLVCMVFIQAGFSEPLFTQMGGDPPFTEVLKSGNLPQGENSKTGRRPA